MKLPLPSLGASSVLLGPCATGGFRCPGLSRAPHIHFSPRALPDGPQWGLMDYMQDRNLAQIPGGDYVPHSSRASLGMAHLSPKGPISNPGDRHPGRVFKEQEVGVQWAPQHRRRGPHSHPTGPETSPARMCMQPCVALPETGCPGRHRSHSGEPWAVRPLSFTCHQGQCAHRSVL